MICVDSGPCIDRKARIDAARREGVIEGLLEWVLEMALTPMPHDPALVKLIRAELERLRSGAPLEPTR